MCLSWVVVFHINGSGTSVAAPHGGKHGEARLMEKEVVNLFCATFNSRYFFTSFGVTTLSFKAAMFQGRVVIFLVPPYTLDQKYKKGSKNFVF